MRVKEIEKAITQLSPNELTKLMGWLDEFYAQVWDKKLEDDLDSGRLDDLLAEVDADYEAGL